MLQQQTFKVVIRLNSSKKNLILIYNSRHLRQLLDKETLFDRQMRIYNSRHLRQLLDSQKVTFLGYYLQQQTFKVVIRHRKYQQVKFLIYNSRHLRQLLDITFIKFWFINLQQQTFKVVIRHKYFLFLISVISTIVDI